MSMQSPHILTTAQTREREIDYSAGQAVDTDGTTGDAIASNALLGQKGSCIIVHNREQYILRRTRNNKLILTK